MRDLETVFWQLFKLYLIAVNSREKTRSANIPSVQLQVQIPIFSSILLD